MSDAAEAEVKACTHPDVKGAALALLTAIAQLIPEGQTTTPSIRLDDLAVLAKHNERTARRSRDLLERIRVIKVHEGGQGRPGARYEILQLAGVRPPIEASLPLRADLRPAPRRAKAERSTPDLFTEKADLTSDILSEAPTNIGHFVRSWWGYFGHFVRSWVGWAKGRRSASDILSEVVGSTSDILSEAGSVHLDLDLSSRSLEVEDRARARGAPEFLDWWVATFAATVERLRDGPLIHELLATHAFEDLQALASVFWGIQSDGVLDSNWDWIAKSNHSVIVFHRKIKFLEEERDRLAAAANRDPPADWWAECKAEHGGTCAKRWDHEWRMRESRTG